MNSIFNRSILFVAIGSTAGLWWLLRYLDSRPLLAWTGIWLAYWFVLFSRETGIVLPALALGLVVAAIYLYRRERPGLISDRWINVVAPSQWRDVDRV